MARLELKHAALVVIWQHTYLGVYTLDTLLEFEYRVDSRANSEAAPWLADMERRRPPLCYLILAYEIPNPEITSTN